MSRAGDVPADQDPPEAPGRQSSQPPPVSGSLALPSSSSAPEVVIDSSPEPVSIGSSPVTEPTNLQDMSPKGTDIFQKFRKPDESAATSPEQVRPQDIRIPTSPPRGREVTVIQPVVTYHTSSTVNISSSSRRGARSTRSSSPPCDAKVTEMADVFRFPMLDYELNQEVSRLISARRRSHQ